MTEIQKTFFIIPAIGIIIVFALLFMPSNAEDLYFVNSGGGSGVTSLTSNNSAITLNATSGDILIGPKLELLCQDIAPNGDTSMSCTLSDARKNIFLEILHRGNNSGSTGFWGVRYNGDGGLNYSNRYSLNGAADVTSGGGSACRPVGFTHLTVNVNALLTGHVYNYASGNNKLQTGFLTYSTDGAQSLVANRVEYSCQWSDTSNQITSIEWLRLSGTNFLAEGSSLTVWGYD